MEVYNLNFKRSGADARIRSQVGTNDVLEIVGELPFGAFFTAKPKPIGFGERARMQATMGVPIDGGTPWFDGLIPGESFAAVQISDVQGGGFVIGAAFPFEDGIKIVGATELGTFNQKFIPDVFAVDIAVDRGVFPIGGVPQDGSAVWTRPEGSTGEFDLFGFVPNQTGVPTVVSRGFSVPVDWARAERCSSTMFSRLTSEIRRASR